MGWSGADAGTVEQPHQHLVDVGQRGNLEWTRRAASVFDGSPVAVGSEARTRPKK